MSNERIIQLINQVQRNAGCIPVCERIDGELRRITLLDLPTDRAIHHTCEIVRAVLRNEDAMNAMMGQPQDGQQDDLHVDE